MAKAVPRSRPPWPWGASKAEAYNERSAIVIVSVHVSFQLHLFTTARLLSKALLPQLPSPREFSGADALLWLPCSAPAAVLVPAAVRM